MNKGTISTKLTDYNIYNEGEMLIGTNGEVTLPDLEAVTSEIGGAGIAGTMEDPTPGYFGSLEIELKFRTVSEESSRLMIPQAHTLTLRAAQTKHDPATGTNSQEWSYVTITRGSGVVLELDKFNHIFVVEGIDYMKEIRDLI